MCASVTDGSRSQSCVNVTQQQAPGHVSVLGGGGCVSEYRAGVDERRVAVRTAKHSERPAFVVSVRYGFGLYRASFCADSGNQSAYSETG